LFAALPSEGSIKSSVVNKAKSMAAAWGAYCATTSAINKSFISVKGVYMEAAVQGMPIRWIVPHSFTQYLPQDVDYRVMMTFFEFYEVLLKFVLFKLFNDIGVRFPLPANGNGSGTAVGSTSAVLSGHLKALRNALDSSTSAISDVVKAAVEKEQTENDGNDRPSSATTKATKEWDKAVGAALNSLPEESDEDADDDAEEEDVDVAGPLKAALDNMAEEEARTSVPALANHLDDDGIKRKRLFAGLTFFFSREIPRGYLELVCLAYGGNFGWEGDGSPISMKDPTITHHIVDRPKLQASYDILPKSREYVQPQWIVDCANNMFMLPVSKYAVGATLPPHLSPWVDNEEEGYKPAYAEEIERLKNGEDPASIVSAESEPDSDEKIFTEAAGTTSDASDDEGDDEEPVEDSDEDEEEKERRVDRKRQKEEEEAKRLAKTMMSKKATHLYNRMQHGLAQKKEKVDVLHQRRKQIDSTKEKDESGKTPLKQKVERLKKERKGIEDSYAQTDGTMKKSKKSKH
jgi:pescadillo protein